MNQHASFTATALPFVLKHEGGFVDDPDDPGGATNFGVSLRQAIAEGDIDGDGVLDFDIDGDGDVDADDIRAMTEADAARYYAGKWSQRRYADIANPIVAAKLFDVFVHTGFYRASLIAQRGLMAAGVLVKDDGVMGSRTVAALNTFGLHNRAAAMQGPVIYAAITAEQAAFYRSLKSTKYEGGWLARAYDKPEDSPHDQA